MTITERCAAPTILGFIFASVFLGCSSSEPVANNQDAQEIQRLKTEVHQLQEQLNNSKPIPEQANPKSDPEQTENKPEQTDSENIPKEANKPAPVNQLPVNTSSKTRPPATQQTDNSDSANPPKVIEVSPERSAHRIDIAASEDGTRLVSNSHLEAIQIWDLKTGDKIQHFLPLTHGGVGEMNSDGTNIVTHKGNEIVIWDTQSRRVLSTIKEDQDVLAVCYSPDGQYLASSSENYTVNLRNAKTGKLIKQFSGFQTLVRRLRISIDNKRVLCEGPAIKKLVWDVDSGTPLLVLPERNDRMKGFKMSPDGGTVAAIVNGKLIHLWDVKTGVETVLGNTSGFFQDLFFSGDGKRLFTTNTEEIKLWDINQREVIRSITFPEEHFVFAVSYSPDGKYILTSRPSQFLIQEASTGILTYSQKISSTDSASLQFNTDGSQVLTTLGGRTARYGRYKQIKSWELGTGREKSFEPWKNDYTVALAYSRDSKRIAIGTGANLSIPRDNLIIIDAVSGAKLSGFRCPYIPYFITFTADGEMVAVGQSGKHPLLINARTGMLIRKFEGDVTPSEFVFSPDGAHLAAGLQRGGSLMVWDVQTGEPVYTSAGHSRYLTAINYSPDGRHIATGGDDSTVIIWDAKTGQSINILRGHSGGIDSVGFSPNGKTIVTGSRDNTARIWDVATGKQLRVLPRPITSFRLIRGQQAFLPQAFIPSVDGNHAVSVTSDGTTALWNTQTEMVDRVFNQNTSMRVDGSVILKGSYEGNRIVLQHRVQNEFGGAPRTKVWDSKSGELLVQFVGATSPHQQTYSNVHLNPNGTQLFATGGNKAFVWNVKTGHEVMVTEEQVWKAKMTPNWNWLVTSTNSGIKIWDFTLKEVIQTINAQIGSVGYLDISNDGRYITYSRGRGVALIDIASGNNVGEFNCGDVTCLSFNPDGNQIAVGNEHNEVLLLDTKSKQLQFVLKGHQSDISCLAFSPDGAQLVSWAGYSKGNSRRLRIWNPATGELVRTFNVRETFNESPEINSVLFSSDGEQIISTGRSGKIYVLDLNEK